MREIGQHLTRAEAEAAIDRIENYRREWGDYEDFGDDALKAQRVADYLTAYITSHQAIPASLTEEESCALW